MYYTPGNLSNITFRNALVNGYSKSQVNDILAKIIEDYIQNINENNQLRSQIMALNETVQHYKTIEESLQHSIIIAQHTGDNIKKNACEKAQNIIDEAEIKVQKLISDANQEVAKIKFAYEEIKSKLYTFKTKTEALLLSQLELLKQLSDDCYNAHQ